jgi:hypothetical protein
MKCKINALSGGRVRPFVHTSGCIVCICIQIAGELIGKIRKHTLHEAQTENGSSFNVTRFLCGDWLLMKCK